MTDTEALGAGLLISVVLVALVVVSVVAIGGALAQGGGPLTPTTPTAAFENATVSQEQGDVAAIPIGLNGTTTANVTVGSRFKNYEAVVRVVDSDDDGHVKLLMNTYIAGRNETGTEAYEAAGNDTVASVAQPIPGIGEPLAPSSYNLSVAVATTKTGSATLKLGARSTDELVTWTAPAASFEDVKNASDVAAAVDAGTITTLDRPANTVADGDVLVTQVRASGIYGALAAENLSTLLDQHALGFRMRQTNPETNRRPKHVNVSASLAEDAISVIPDPENDAVYLDVNTSAAVVAGGSIAAGDDYQVTFGVNASSGLAAKTQTLSANVSIASPELGLEDVALVAAANQTVGGTASVAPGSVVRVNASEVGNGSFFESVNTTVRSNNASFTAPINLSGLAPNTTIAVNATGPLNTSDAVEVAVGRPQPTVSPTRSESSPENRSTNESATPDTTSTTSRTTTTQPGTATAPVETSPPTGTPTTATTVSPSSTTEPTTDGSGMDIDALSAVIGGFVAVIGVVLVLWLLALRRRR